jgi:hypothetical protein
LANSGKLVALKRSDGKEVWVNVDLVRLVSPAAAGKCMIWFAVDHSYDIFGDAREVAGKLNAE